MHHRFSFIYTLGFVFTFLFLLALKSSASEIVTSPDKKISIIISIQEKSSPYPEQEHLYYSVYYMGDKIIADSPLGLLFYKNPPIEQDLRLYNVQNKKITEPFVPIFEKADTSAIEYNQIILYLQEKHPPFRIFTVEFRINNAGLAFRYIVPVSEKFSLANIKDEITGFYFADDYKILSPSISDINTTDYYTNSEIAVSRIEDTLNLVPPVLFKTNNDLYLEILETGITNYPYAWLCPVKQMKYSFKTSLQRDSRWKSRSFSTPWRVILIGKNPGSFAYENFIYCLNAPHINKDLSWIKGGTYLTFKGDADSDSLLQTIKFCSENQINYIVIPEENKIDSITEICKKQNVKIILKTDQSFLSVNTEKKISDIVKLGASGLFVKMSNNQTSKAPSLIREILQDALSDSLMTGFIGNGNFTGLSRTFPNFTTLILDISDLSDNYKENVSYLHTIIPFYNMTGLPFDLCSISDRKIKNKSSKESPTLCHFLALHILSKSKLQSMDNQKLKIDNKEIKIFFNNASYYWDETIFIDGVFGQYFIAARRRGSTWYVAAISNSLSGTINIPLSFIDKESGEYQASIYYDNPSSAPGQDKKIITKQTLLTPSDKLSVFLTSKGGYIAVIKPAN